MAMASSPADVRSARASLYLDTAEGFGEWPLLLSSRVLRNLRETHKKVPDRARIYLNKLRWVRPLRCQRVAMLMPSAT
jgi:hypothetical protein